MNSISPRVSALKVNNLPLPLSDRPAIKPSSGWQLSPGFADIRKLFTIGPNPMERIRPNSSPSVAELLTIQRAFSEYALKVELCAKTADAVSGVIRRLQQGG